MKKSALILLPLIALALTACEFPDIAGLNSMPDKTGEMSNKMDTTNAAIHKQTLLLALVELNKPENQENIYPVPTGLMPAGKVFAEEATAAELIELTYNELKKLEENAAVYGYDKDGVPVPLTEAEQNMARRKKMATLYSLLIISGFAQDEKIDEIINHDIHGNGRFRETALSFLVLREYFLREILLKLSLKIERDKPETLDNSGKMNEALKYLVKMDKILKLDLPLNLKLKGEATFLGFDYTLGAARSEGVQMWEVAIEKATAGSQGYMTNSSSDSPGSNKVGEIASQNQAIQTMKQYLASWKQK